MIPAALLAGTSLDDFLTDAAAANDAANTLRTAGLACSIAGVLTAAGILVFLIAVMRGSRFEIRLLTRLAAIAGAITIVGAVAEVAGIAQETQVPWTDAVRGPFGAGAMLRLIGGLLVVCGLFDLAESDGDRMTGSDPVRWVGTGASSFGVGGVLLSVCSFAFDGHTVTQGPRVVHAIANIVHVASVSTWMGGVVGLSAVAIVRRRAAIDQPLHDSIGWLVIRFSSVATLALVAAVGSGSMMIVFTIDEFGDLTGTPWGRALIVKLFLVGVITALGAYSHFVVVPAWGRQAANPDMERRGRIVVLFESCLFLVLAVLTAVVTNASIN